MFKQSPSFHVLYTTDVKKTHDFFVSLGVEIKQLADDKVVVTFGPFELHYILNTTEPFIEYRYIAEPGSYGQGIIFYIESTQIADDQQRVEKAGGVIKAPVFLNNWGYQEVLFEDPNGYKFALYQEVI